jgi:hypothetical protein
VSAGIPERQRTGVVERGMEALARLDDAERIDRREDLVIDRIHKHVHTLERIDELDDANRAALREDLLQLTGYVDRLAPQQLPLITEAAS